MNRSEVGLLLEVVMHLGYWVHESNGACSGNLDWLAPHAPLHGGICLARGARSRTLGDRRTAWLSQFSVLGQVVQAIINPVVGTSHGSGRCAMKVHDFAELPLALAALISLVASAAGGQEKNETRYVVGRNPIVSITNKYGPVTVKPSENRQVVVGTTSHSDRIKFVNEQRGNRIEVRADASDRSSALVEYRVLVPSDAFVS